MNLMVRSRNGLSLLHLMQQAQSSRAQLERFPFGHTPREQELYSYNRFQLQPLVEPQPSQT
jgi:hypothetical protein